VLVTDRSGSMNIDAMPGTTRLELAKRGSIDFIRMLTFAPPTAVAVTAFDQGPAIISDFRTTPDPLVNAILSIGANGGTEYTPAFMDPLAGGITLLASRPDTIRRILIFLTDGEPSRPPLVTEIINLAKQYDVEVYAITIAMPMNRDLRLISEATGGAWFENVATVEQIQAIYRAIALKSQGIASCTIRWRVPERCAQQSQRHDVRVTLRTRGISATGSYMAPAGSGKYLDLLPNALWFGPIAWPATADRQLTITARNGDFDITGAPLSGGTAFSITDWGGVPPPFTLASGDSRTITVHYAPPDSLLYVATLQVEATPCPPQPVILTGGTRRQNAPGVVYLLTPVGGETFSGCDSIVIRWGGIAPGDTVQLEYSDDDGRTWKLIVDGATGLTYRWMPPAQGSRYQIKVSARGDGKNMVATVVGGGQNPNAALATQVLLTSPTGVAARGDTLYLAESGGHIIRCVDMVTGRIATIAGNGSPGRADGRPASVTGRLNGPQGLALSGDTLYIADYNNHLIRRLELSTSTLTTVAGTGQSGFAGDGGFALNASLQFPAYITVRGPDIFFSDAGNNRIRRINLETNIITTVAGGGTSPVGNSGLATSIMLSDPQGLVAAGDRLYFAERGAHIFRMLDLKSGQLTTIAGRGTRGLGGDGGFALNALFSGPMGVAIAGNTLFVTDTGSHRVRAIDLNSGIITAFAGDTTLIKPGFAGDGGHALTARFDRTGHPVISGDRLYLPDIGNDRIRTITLGRLNGIDSSKQAFTVSVARLRASAVISGGINMGTFAIGATHDSVIVGAICNTGDLPLVVNSVTMIGAHPGDFAIVSGISTIPIPPGGCREIEFRFAPTGVGMRTARVVIGGECASADTITLRGIGTEPCGITVVERVNFGVVKSGVDRDTTMQQIICNTGTQPLHGTITISPSDAPFTILQGGGDFTLAKGECRRVVLRFSPRGIGRVSARIDYGTPAICEPAMTLLFGEGARGSLAVEAIAFPAVLCDGAMRDTTVVLENTGALPLNVTGASIAPLGVGFLLLPPVPSSLTPLVIPAGASDTLHLRFAPLSAGTKTAVLSILSDIGTTDVLLSGVRDSLRIAPLSDPVIFGLSSGAFPRDSFIVIENTGTVAVEITGGTIVGGDAAQFELLPSQLPRTIAPGRRDTIRIRALAPATLAAFRAQLRLTASPTCDSGIVAIDLVVPGSLPELSALPMVFPPLVCGDELRRDTMLTVRNIGSGDLNITAFRIEGDAEGNFAFTGTIPTTISAGGSASLPVHFAPQSTGAKSATLVLTSNSAAGETRIALSGRRDTTGFTASDSALFFEVLVAGGSDLKSMTITNTGTAPMAWQLPPSVGQFTVVSITPVITPPGGSSTVTIRFNGSTEGYFRDTLHAQEPQCGTTWLLALQGVVGTPVHFTAILPIDSAKPSEEVAFPIRAIPDDTVALALSRARTYTVTIQFHGVLFVPESVTRGTILSKSYDPLTNIQKVTISGDYGERAGDTLTSLVGVALLGDRPTTPLEFVSFTWDAPGIATDTINGLFTVIGTCTDVQLRTVSAPKIVVIAPQPASSHATVELELEQWLQLRASLVDATGREVASIADGIFEAGRHSLPLTVGQLPSGVYSLVVETVYGRVVEQIVVVQ
jgi:hypothetical protein